MPCDLTQFSPPNITIFQRSRQHELRKRLDDMYKVELVKRVKSEREKKGDEAVMTLLTHREKVRRSKRRRPQTAPAHIITPTVLGYDEEKGRLFYNVCVLDTGQKSWKTRKRCLLTMLPKYLMWTN